MNRWHLDYDYFRSQERAHTESFPIDDIPNYPVLFIRDGAFVFVVQKATGEISERLTLSQYVDRHIAELKNNPAYRDFYFGGYFNPKDSPDTARTIKELRQLCSDSTRHVKGYDSYFLDFLTTEQANVTQHKMFTWICKNVVVWNYSVFSIEEVLTSVPRTKRQARTVFQELQDKGLIKVVTDKFEGKKDWRLLVKVHPKLYWKGRYTAWASRAGMDYEYEDPTGTIEGNSISS